MALIILLSDFGQESFYPAAMKGVILAICPAARIVDITHAVPEHDIAAGSFALYATYRAFPPGAIHVGVVDPGVGSQRTILAVELNRHIFLTPDNGLLSFILKSAAPDRIFTVTNRALWNREVSPTFHGRDIFAPVAAHLACGTPLEQVGPPQKSIVRLDIPSARATENGLAGEIVSVDRFGNLVTNISAEMLPAAPAARDRIVVRLSGRDIHGLRLTYADVGLGELVAYVGSAGLLEIGRNRGSARDILGAGIGHAVHVAFQE